MAATTPQNKAINAANILMLSMGQFQTLRKNMTDWLAENSSEGYSAIWSNLPTVALKADGSLGTSDANPDPGHPIAINTLLKNVTASQLIAGMALLQDFVKFLGNQTVNTAQRSQTVDDLAP